MPYDGQGVFTRVHNWEEDAANDISILASRHDAEDDNFANGFNEVLCRDGRAAMTGNLKMGANKITGLANGTTDNDAVNLSQLNSTSSTLSTAINTAVTNLLSGLYPVGSVYIGTQTTCPLASLMPSTTWTLVSSGKALWTGNGSNANTTIAAGLPNITGSIGFSGIDPGTTTGTASGAFTKSNANGAGDSHYSSIANGLITFSLNASNSNSIYGNSSTVQPPAYVVNVWRRTA